MKLMLAQNTAQQRAAARTEQQAQRRAAACKNALAFTRPGGRNGRQANPCADGKGAGGEHPGAACDNL